MSQGASPPPADGTRPAASGGLASSLKVAVPLVALVAVVFGVTYIMMYAPTKPGDEQQTGPQNTASTAEPPLRFFNSLRRWDPPKLKGEYREFPLSAPSAVGGELGTGRAFSHSLQDRLFQGFYEPSNDPRDLRRTQFWFENRNPNSVTMRLQGLSCSACTGGRLTPIPPEVTRGILQHAALTALPCGMVNGFAISMAGPAAGLRDEKLQWTGYAFRDHPQAAFQVPAAANADGWSPQWGILELTFQVGTSERKEPLTADFLTRVDGTEREASHRFGILFDVAKQCELSRPNIDAGKIDPLSGDRRYDFLVYSSTRGPGSEYGDLDEPSCVVEAPPGDTTPFVEVLKSEIARVPQAELLDLEQTLQKPIRSAYRVVVVVRPKVGEKRMDIGHFERTISLTAGGVTHQLNVTATVRGAVWLDGERTEITLGDFAGNRELVHRADLTTEKPGVELAVVKDACKPENFKYELEKQPDRAGRGHYKLKITIPVGSFGKVKGEAVLEVKGAGAQRMRIPVTGQGAFRGN